MFLSILELGLHKLLITHGLNLVTSSLRRWEAFSTLGAFTHTRITWALSTLAPQVLSVNFGFLCAHGLAGTPHKDVRNGKNPLAISNFHNFAIYA